MESTLAQYRVIFYHTIKACMPLNFIAALMFCVAMRRVVIHGSPWEATGGVDCIIGMVLVALVFAGILWMFLYPVAYYLYQPLKRKWVAVVLTGFVMWLAFLLNGKMLFLTDYYNSWLVDRAELTKQFIKHRSS